MAQEGQLPGTFRCPTIVPGGREKLAGGRSITPSFLPLNIFEKLLIEVIAPVIKSGRGPGGREATAYAVKVAGL